MSAFRLAVFKQLFGLIVLLGLSACSTPASRIDDTAASLGFTRSVLRGTDFLHVVYHKESGPTAEVLHVYLEGDGSPWIGTRRVAGDPTPRNPLMLRLMALDSAPSVYLGRPCYYGQANIPPCSPRLWTHERYSARVVESMAAALHQLTKAYPHVVVFGHSGGGTLAMLLADRFAKTRAVVTLAGNLDVAAWAEYHHYSPLDGSLDPAVIPDLDRNIMQKHYVGSLDKEVPPLLTKKFASSRPGAEMIEFDGFDHHCCWEEVWFSILQDMNASLLAK